MEISSRNIIDKNQLTIPIDIGYKQQYYCFSTRNEKYLKLIMTSNIDYKV